MLAVLRIRNDFVSDPDTRFQSSESNSGTDPKFVEHILKL